MTLQLLADDFAAEEILRESLINFHLDRQNFDALRDLFVVRESASQWVWIHGNNKGDYFVAKQVAEEIEQQLKDMHKNANSFMQMCDEKTYRLIKIERLIHSYIERDLSGVTFMAKGELAVLS
jgi:hypothetical protein